MIQNFYALKGPLHPILVIIGEKHRILIFSNILNFLNIFSKFYDNFFDSHHYATTYRLLCSVLAIGHYTYCNRHFDYCRLCLLSMNMGLKPI